MHQATRTDVIRRIANSNRARAQICSRNEKHTGRTLEKSKKPIDIELGDAETLVKDWSNQLSLLEAYDEVDRPLFISKVCK